MATHDIVGDVVSLHDLCDTLILDYTAQKSRISRDKKFKGVLVTNDRTRQTFCIPVSQIPGFLFHLNVDHVRPALRGALKVFQNRCFYTLSEGLL